MGREGIIEHMFESVTSTAAAMGTAASMETAALMETPSLTDTVASIEAVAPEGALAPMRSVGSMRASASITTAPEPQAVQGAVERLTEGVRSLTDDALVDQSRRIAAAISAAEAELAAVLAEVERRGLHGSWDCPSVERFATWHCQLAPSRAAAIASVGRALTELPVVAAAVVSGQLPLAKSAPIIAIAAPDTESALVELATHATVSQTRRICASWRRAEQVESGAADADPTAPPGADPTLQQRVIVIRDHDGIELRARFDHINGELVLASLDAAAALVRSERADAAAVPPTVDHPVDGSVAGFRPASVDDIGRVRLTREQWRAQGLLRICESSPTARPTGLQRSGFTAQVVVHVPVATLLDPSMLEQRRKLTSRNPDPHPARPDHLRTADILEPSGARVVRDAARWLACDADLLTVLDTDAGDPLHLGRRSTTITPQQRRAVHARFRTCAWPGCASTFVQVHHRHHRALGGHDDIENLVAECHYHHALIHRHHITVSVDPDGTVHHRRPDGTEIGHAPPADQSPPIEAGDGLTTLERRQSDLGIDLDDPDRLPRWTGDPFHLADCVDAIFARREAALRRTQPS